MYCNRFAPPRLLVLLALVGCISALPFASVIGEDWPGWRGPDRTNRSSETDLFENWGDDGPELAWMAEGMGGGYASVSVVDGHIFTTGNFDDGQSVVAVDAATGKVRWRQTITLGVPEHRYEGSRSTPTIAGEKLYAVSSDGRIVCLNISDGSQVWARDFSDWDGRMMSGWGFSESPLIDGDRVICTPGGERGMVVCLEKDTGKEIWAAVLADSDCESDKPDLKDGAGYSSVRISNGGGVKQYVQFVGRGVIGVRADDGELLWCYSRVANPVANISTPLIDGDHVFVSSAYTTGSALLKLSSAPDRRTEVNEVYWLGPKQLQNKHGGMTLVDGHIYCGHGNGGGLPICVELASGEVRWGPKRTKGKGEASLVYADGHIVWRRQNGLVTLTKVNPDDLEIVGSFQPEYQEGETWSHPVIADGKLYLREQDKLMCYRLK